ncbi:glycosyltransferase family 9 protein [Vibrio sp. HN007]|uniref:glycosyltransferase family 9 protein n=1 Tax=Vibrio iocasae TaxID=3098914 RepID=UPI0035D3F4B2
MKHLWFEKGAYASKQAKHYLNDEFSPEKVKKIAVIRHAALGDQVIVRPFLIEARKFFPNAEITLIGVSNYQYGMPSDLVDRVIVQPGREQKNQVTFKDKIKNTKELGEQDIIFDLACTNRSYWMVGLNKAKLKFGFPYRSYLCGTLYNIAVHRSDFVPEVESMLHMLKMLGHNPTYPLEFAYPDHRDLCNKREPYILYFNGASQLRKILTKEQMKQLVEDATTAYPDVKHIYLEGKNDFEKGAYLQDLTKKDNFEIQECLPLDEVIELIAKARMVVAPDTGIRNIAISTHTPTIGLFFATVPYRYTPRYERHHIVMNANADAPSSQQIVDAIGVELSNE